VLLAQESVGWEFVITGLLDHNTYRRVAVVNLPLALLPRRESTCAHTINQQPGTVFNLPNLVEDWRFRESPHVEKAGMRAYAGVPLRFDTEYGESVAFGSLCVASNTAQESPTKAQQMSLIRLADWIVADLVHSARARRQRDRRRMVELIAVAQKMGDDNSLELEEAVLAALKSIYPEAMINIQASQASQIVIEGREQFPASELENGLWEDSEFLDFFIENYNHQDPEPRRAVRAIAAAWDNVPVPTFLVVASRDVSLVFDDIDAWFVQTCASLLSRGWQNRLLKEALRAKEDFLRGITHQLRTPLHGILGSVELLAEELKSRDLVGFSPTAMVFTDGTPAIEQPDPSVYIDAIRSSGRDLISTVNNMIKLNRWAEITKTERVDSVHHIKDLERGLLNEVLQAISEDSLRRPSIFFHYKLPPNCDSLTIDFTLLKDCILPLVINAIQNTPNGIVAVTITVTDDYHVLTVDIQDTGNGIDTSDYERIFEAYEKVDTHTVGGAGLGLTLSSKLATLMGGNVSLIASEVGKGSHFRVSLYEPGCSCSPRPPPQAKERFKHLPSYFRSAASSTDTHSLSYYFTDWLVGCGFTALPSAATENTFLVLDYVPDSAELRVMLSALAADQIAICLVPASENSMDFDRIWRDGNVVYVKGPFLSSCLEEALEQASAILAEFASINAIVSPSPEDDVLVEVLDPVPGMNDVEYASAPDTIDTLKAAEALVESIERLEIVPEPTALIPYLITASPSQPTALVVDDNEINLRIMTIYCSKRNIPFVRATDGLQAIALYSSHQPSCASHTSTRAPIDLILMDLQMPVCDGISATRHIRMLEKQNGWRRSVIFIVTGQDSPKDRRDAKAAEADEYFVKPVGPKVLDRGVRRYFPGFLDKS
jgi:signal transduction histidine kinase/CheY-like chemotaxis protein